MKFLIALFFFSGLLFSSPAASASDTTNVLEEARAWVRVLKSGNMQQAIAHLDPNVQVRSWNNDELKKVVDKLILGQISAVDYLRILSGYNVYKLIESPGDGMIWKITSNSIQQNVFLDSLKIGASQVDYFFMRVTLYVAEVSQDAQGERRNDLRLDCELGLVRSGSDFKIVGFIF